MYNYFCAIYAALGASYSKVVHLLGDNTTGAMQTPTYALTYTDSI